MKKIELINRYDKDELAKTLNFVKKEGAERIRNKLKLKVKLLRGGWCSCILSNQYVVTNHLMKNKIELTTIFN